MNEFFPGVIDPIQEPEQSPVTEGWAHFPHVKQRHLDALSSLIHAPLPTPRIEADQGMVIVGGGKFLEGMVIAARMLREVGSTMPIQIWHRGDLEPIRDGAFDGIGGVTIIDSLRHAESIGGARIMRGWEQKLHALVHCNFRQILYLDADAYVVDNPAPLMKLLDRSPFVFWADLAGNYATVKWSNCWPDGENNVPAIQGGQLAIDREKAWRTLILAHWMNQHSDYYYSHMFGDQDTWRVALAAQKTKGWHNIGPAQWVDTAFVCGVEKSKPIVVHRCQGKLFRPEHIPAGKQAYSAPKWSLPQEKKVFRMFASLLADIDDSAGIFGEIYRKKLWGDMSGPGSDLATEARPYVDLMNTIIEIGGIKSVIDLGCGDGRVGMALKVPSYVGIDCHDEYTEKLRRIAPDRQWIVRDFYRHREDIPDGEALLIKDVFHHWPNKMIIDFLGWAIRSGKWNRIIFTQDCHQQEDGSDTYLGGYRALNPVMNPLKQFAPTTIVSFLHKAALMVKCK